MFKETLSKFFKVDSLIGNVSGYLEARLELLKIEMKEEVAKGLARGVLWALIAFAFALFIAFLSIAVALWLSMRFGAFAGFGMVGAFYLIAGVGLLFFRDKITSGLEKRFSTMFKKKE